MLCLVNGGVIWWRALHIDNDGDSDTDHIVIAIDRGGRKV